MTSTLQSNRLRQPLSSIRLLFLGIVLSTAHLAAQVLPAERRELVDRVLNDLTGRPELPSSYYEHFEISPDGKWVAFTQQRGSGEQDASPPGDVRVLPGGVPVTLLRGDILIAPLEAPGPVRDITQGRATRASSWHASWSPDSQSLAFFTGTADGVRLRICQSVTGHPQCSSVSSLIVKSSLFARDYPRWLPDGKRILIPLVPEIERELRPGIEDNPLYSIPEHYRNYLDPDSEATVDVVRSGTDVLGETLTQMYRVDLGIYDVNSRRLERVTEERNIHYWEVCPDGQKLALKEFVRTLPGSQSRRYSLHVVDLRTGASRQLLEESHHSIQWSGDSQNLLDLTDEGLVAVDVAGQRMQKIELPQGEKPFPPDDMPDATIGFFLWSLSGDEILVRGKSGWWSVPREGGEAHPVFRELDTPPHLVRLGSSGVAAELPGGNRILEGQGGSGETVWLSTGASGGPARIGERGFRVSSSYHAWSSGSSFRVVFGSAAGGTTDLWFGNMVEGEFRRITELADGIVPLSSHRVRQIEYRGGGGELLKGALLLPPNLIDGQAYPTVCLVYAGSVLVDAERAFSNGFNPVGSLPRMLAEMGYVVLRPSIPLTPTGQKSSPAEEIPAPVLAALDRAIEMGIADPERIGVLGQSYGGYTTQVLITRTTRFKAAVSMAGLSNLISHYGDFDARRRHRAGKSTAPNWAEQGQGRMGVPIWDDPWNYVENSPVFRLEKVETPLTPDPR